MTPNRSSKGPPTTQWISMNKWLWYIIGFHTAKENERTTATSNIHRYQKQSREQACVNTYAMISFIAQKDRQNQNTVFRDWIFFRKTIENSQDVFTKKHQDSCLFVCLFLTFGPGWAVVGIGSQREILGLFWHLAMSYFLSWYWLQRVTCYKSLPSASLFCAFFYTCMKSQIKGVNKESNAI